MSLFKSGKPSNEREERLAALVRRMDDGMGICRDDPGYVTGRYAHFAEKSQRNVYTEDDPAPHEGYADWKRLLTWDLDENVEVWPEDRKVKDG